MRMEKKESEQFYAAGRKEWREWLEKHHRSVQSVWLVQYKKNTDMPTLSWSEAVDEALCFGWIDSTRKTLDSERFIQFFCPRKSGSAWSKINKEKVEHLIAEGMMTAAGLESIATAKQNGSWSILDDVEDLKIPKDLVAALKKQKKAREYFDALSKSVKKMMLYWIVSAKRPETREKRIAEIAEHAARQERPRQFR
jgi:uncharacterized protein YdeI (YjbR/CyaY-like superfamily)